MNNEERGACKTCASHRVLRHLLVQCESPIVQPPNIHVENGQALLALETGRFYYWGIKETVEINDGINDHFEYCWKEVKCGEGSPIAYRQSQIFFQDNFDGNQTVRGPPISTEEGGKKAQPKRGDYLIDNVNHSLWLMNVENEWVLQTQEFGTIDSTQETLTIEKTSSIPMFNNNTNRFEVSYYITICNHQTVTSDSFDVTDDAREKAQEAGLGPEIMIEFLLPSSDSSFINADFAGLGSYQNKTNVLVPGKTIAANSCQTIRYVVSGTTWQTTSSTATMQNTATLTLNERSINTTVAATSNTEIPTSAYPGHVSFSMRFGQQIDESLTRTRTSVKTVVCNIGPTPVTITAIQQNIFDALHSDSFSIATTPVAQWNAGSGALPTLNVEFDGYNNIYLLNSPFCLTSGRSFQIDFDVSLSILALHQMQNRIQAKADVFYLDVWNVGHVCCAPDIFCYNPTVGAGVLNPVSETLFDAHVEDQTIHHVINDAGSGVSDLWSASKMVEQLATKCALSHVHNASDITNGLINDARIGASSVIQHVGSLSHQALAGAGTKTHAELDLHVADLAIHRQINDAGNTATDLWSASQIVAQLLTKSATDHVHAAAQITSGTFADARVAASNVVQHNSALSHNLLTGAGSKTHEELDAHVVDLSIHRQIYGLHQKYRRYYRPKRHCLMCMLHLKLHQEPLPMPELLRRA